MRRIGRIITSNKLTLVALVLMAAAMGWATFLENDFGTPVARQVVYDAWWFELLMAILAVNFIANIYRYRLFRKEKLSLLVFHLAFVIILIGAFVTRYAGFEGLVRIREGQKTNLIITQERYLKAHVAMGAQTWSVEKSLPLTKFNQPYFDYTFGNSEAFRIKGQKFVPDAVQTLEAGEQEVLEIVASAETGRSEYFLQSGESIYINGHRIGFNAATLGDVNITSNGEYYEIDTQEPFGYIIMATQRVGNLVPGQSDSLHLRTLYQSAHINFVVSAVHQNKKLTYETTEDKELAKNAADLLFLNLEDPDTSATIVLAALDGVFSPLQDFQFGDYDIKISYGPKLEEMPFQLELKDFKLTRYPGSTSPSAYASDLIVWNDDGSSFNQEISMNNVLDHQGYRFFQASYDLDELGTVLSVNQDWWGTQITYLGYWLMGLGMVLTLFGKHSRFQLVSRQLNRLKADRQVAVILIMLAPGMLLGQGEIPKYIDPGHAKQFGMLMIQDMDGRIKPVNTLGSEFLRKVSRKISYEVDGIKWNSDQVFLSIHQNPAAWQHIPIIKVDPKKGWPFLEQLGLEDRKFLSFQDLINDQGNYRLRMPVEIAQRKKPAERSEVDNELIKVDERFNILFQALTGAYLKVFPQPGSEDQKWFDPGFVNAGFSAEDSVFVRNIMGLYYNAIANASASGDWSLAEDNLLYVKTFQDAMGADLIPSDRRVQAELLYNRLQIFNRLFPWFWLVGVVLLGLACFRVFFPTSGLSLAIRVSQSLIFIGFLLMTGNLLLRWYAGGYPPWSNGYEMIILVTWALMLFGFIFRSKSDFVLPVVSIFCGTLLFVSYLDWLNPEITTLVPVLKSYWLKIHVAIIVSSYAPLALSALLGFLGLTFMLANPDRFKVQIKELTYINELSMTIGLFMLAIGTFLGGVWANESWGRYWGWDPKETWALISILVYAAVLHMRLVPGMRGVYPFNLASVLAFFSIIMTSFGVNYYLSGLHSYAAGDPLPIPTFVYWVVGVIILLGMTSFFRNRNLSTS